MKKENEIRSSRFPYDMAPWCIQKMSRVVEELARIVEIVNDKESITEEIREEMLFSLYPAIYDATKMLSFSCGAEWSHTDRDILLKGGDLAFEELQVKYGLIDETQDKDRKRINDINEFISVCRGFLQENRSPNRTFIHELLGRTRIKEPLIDCLGDKLERVTMGEIEWSEFVSKALVLLSDIERKQNRK